jgi:hypothetical protein
VARAKARAGTRLRSSRGCRLAAMGMRTPKYCSSSPRMIFSKKFQTPPRHAQKPGALWREGDLPALPELGLPRPGPFPGAKAVVKLIAQRSPKTEVQGVENRREQRDAIAAAMRAWEERFEGVPPMGSR